MSYEEVSKIRQCDHIFDSNKNHTAHAEMELKHAATRWGSEISQAMKRLLSPENLVRGLQRLAVPGVIGGRVYGLTTGPPLVPSGVGAGVSGATVGPPLVPSGVEAGDGAGVPAER